MTSRSELKAHYLEYIDEIPHSPHDTLAIYCDASTDLHGTTGTGILIPDIDLKGNVRMSIWAKYN